MSSHLPNTVIILDDVPTLGEVSVSNYARILQPASEASSAHGLFSGATMEAAGGPDQRSLSISLDSTEYYFIYVFADGFSSTFSYSTNWPFAPRLQIMVLKHLLFSITEVGPQELPKPLSTAMPESYPPERHWSLDTTRMICEKAPILVQRC